MVKCAKLLGLDIFRQIRNPRVHIVVCIKQTPDSAAEMVVENGIVSWGDTPMVVNPWDEYALEDAIRTKEKYGGHVTAIVMGRKSAGEALKTAIAMGCDSGVMLCDEDFFRCDARGTARILARAIEKLGDVELAFFGKQAIVGDSGLVPLSVAFVLGWTPLSYVCEVYEIDLHEARISVARLLEEGRQNCLATLPAVVSVVKEINEPRYPSFIGIRKASKVEIPVWDLAELGLDDSEIKTCDSAVIWSQIQSLAKSSREVEMIEGDSVEAIVTELTDRLMDDMVI